MNNDRRKQLQQQYKQQRPQARVYRIVNRRTARSLNLPSARGKLDFARRTGTSSALDQDLELLEALWRERRSGTALIRHGLAVTGSCNVQVVLAHLATSQ